MMDTVAAEVANLPVGKASDIAMNGWGITPTNLAEAMKFAAMMANSTMVPDSFKGKPGDVLMAIQVGTELGFSPMQSLQVLASINGRPCIYGDGIPALVHKGGKCEYLKEWFEGEGDTLTAFCKGKRKDQTEPTEHSFSVVDAKTARLWGKAGPWTNYPKRMLQMRARAFTARDAFADALHGLSIAEEAMDIPQPVNITPEPPQGTRTRQVLTRLERSSSEGASREHVAAQEIVNEAATIAEDNAAQDPTVSPFDLEVAAFMAELTDLDANERNEHIIDLAEGRLGRSQDAFEDLVLRVTGQRTISEMFVPNIVRALIELPEIGE